MPAPIWFRVGHPSYPNRLTMKKKFLALYRGDRSALLSCPWSYRPTLPAAWDCQSSFYRSNHQTARAKVAEVEVEVFHDGACSGDREGTDDKDMVGPVGVENGGG